MFRFKYPVTQDMLQTRRLEDAPHIRFDLERLNGGWLKRLASPLTSAFIGGALAVLQVLAPRLRIGRLLVLTRYEDVKAVLNDDLAFAVPFNPEMNRLAGGATFMLGLDGLAHRGQRTAVEAEIGAARIADATAHADRVSAALLTNAPGGIDVIRDYFARVSTECVCRLLGMEPEDPDQFGDWAVSLSALLFGDPFGNKVIAELADHGAWRMRAVADHAIARARESARAEYGDTPAARGNMLADLLSNGQRNWSDAELRALLMGIATGATPTMTLLAGNILEWLLDNPDLWEQAVAAAAEAPPQSGVSRLRLFLREAARFAPALDPGQFRLTTGEARLRGLSKPLKADTVILAATATALRDRRAYPDPERFDPDRSQPAEFLVFGAAPHRCVGREMAEQQLEIMFRNLLRQPGLRRAAGRSGRMHRVGPFPYRLRLEFDHQTRRPGLSMLTIVIPAPAAAGAAQVHVEQRIAEAGRSGEWQAALARMPGVHFGSLSLVGGEPFGAGSPQLLIELTTDGDDANCLEALAREAEDLLVDLLQRIGTRPGIGGLPMLLDRNRLRMARYPWGATGLAFNGQPGQSVPDIDEAAEVARFAADAIDLYLRQSQRYDPRRPMDALRFVRDLILGPVRPAPRRTLGADLSAEMAKLSDRGSRLAHALWRPGSERLPWIGFARPTPFQATLRFLASRGARPVYLLVGGTFLVSLAALALALALGGAELVTIVVAAVSAAVLVSAFLLAGALLLFWRAVRRLEDRDWPDGRDPDQARVRWAARGEDVPGHAQNHFISLSTLKSGPIRRLTLALGLWGIEQALVHAFPPGFASDIGTIHTARWVRLPATNQLLFTANYDGSWESYLEDFVTLANEGQTAAWSNAEGFPPARNMIEAGAADGARFKRWVRLQQQPTGAWYSRHPHLTMERIRRNAEILHGLAHAATDADARNWLSLFGSRPPPKDFVDVDDMQSILLDGHGKLKHGTCLLLRLPPEAHAQERILWTIAEGSQTFPRIAFGIPAQGSDTTAWAAFSARAMESIFGTWGGRRAEEMASFDLPFQAGMAERLRLLGYPDTDLDWSDRDIDIVYVLLAKTEKGLENVTREARDAIKAHDEGCVLREFALQPVDGRVDVEPFGFRDGISQPVMAAARPDRARLNPADVVAPGELIMGHVGNDGHISPGPRVQAERDPLGFLPDAPPPVPGSFPAFRDLGRHGSMVAVQLFEQDVKAFDSFCKQTVTDLKDRYGKALDGISITEKWVASRFVGRWQNGTPLVDSPMRPRANADHNQFGYQLEDPMGLSCPLGAHIRRANPRDALEPVGPHSLGRSNRHRILRRGRAWSAGERQGLLFVGMCASLERQFEFLSRSWLSAPGFAGLDGEVDPLLGPHQPRPGGGAGLFTIPTPKGPLLVRNMESFVTLLGGGYFFMPGRAALSYLMWRMRIEALRQENGLQDKDPLQAIP